MRTLVDIPDDQIQAMDLLASTRQTSRSALIRQAIAAYLADNQEARRGAAFGLWQGSQIDPLELEKNLRSEWGS